MNIEYQYYIIKEPYENDAKKSITIPLITKVRKDKFPFHFGLKNEAEGPFDSLFELKKYSLIFASIKLQKHRDRILKNKNIKEIKDLILTEEDSIFEESFIFALHHIMVGKISKQKVKGIHFLNPENIKIVDIISIDKKTGVYIARIEKLDAITGKWIGKDENTIFFPDNWSINQLFHECYHAFTNKKQVSDNIYKSKTISGVTVKFVIDGEGKILTFYPEIDEE